MGTPRDVVRCIPATCGGFLSSDANTTANHRNIAPRQMPGLSLILRLFFCSGISQRLHSVLRIPQNIIRLQSLHFSYEKGRRVSPCGLVQAQIAITAA
ncbi:hypothetical protein ACLB1Q_23335 [Escherichia coli]